MSLASALLKRLFVHKTLGYPWHSIRFGRKRDPKHGKPCALLPLPAHGAAPVEFNVSHQAGLVALVGCATGELDAELGVDIVCVNERNDTRTIDSDGLEAWLDMFETMFSPAELFDMKYAVDAFTLPDDGSLITPALLGRHDRCTLRNTTLLLTLPDGSSRAVSSNHLIDAKLRRFYTYWCYKEAYIKLDGEAMLATWIPRLEFRSVRAPLPAVSTTPNRTPSSFSTTNTTTTTTTTPPSTTTPSSTTPSHPTPTPAHSPWGERIDDAETWFEGQRLSDVRVEIQAFEDAFMVGVAAKQRQWGAGVVVGIALRRVLPRFERLELEDVVWAAGG